MKRSVKTLLLLCLLLLSVGGYYAVQLFNRPTKVIEESGSYTLIAQTTDSLTGLSWMQDDTVLSFVLSEGVWKYTMDTAFPVNQDEMTALAETAVALEGTRRLENVEALGDYGIDENSFVVTLTFADGTQSVYRMGAATPFADGYYIHASTEENAVYTVEETLEDTFNITLDALAKMEDMPAVTTVTRLRLGDTLDIFKAEKSLTLKTDQLWQNALTGQPLSTALAEDLAELATNIVFEQYVSASPAEEELITWGLSEDTATVLTLYNGDVAERSLLIGTMNEDGAYYARLADSTVVYLLDDNTKTLMAATAESLYDEAPLAIDFAEVAEFTLACNGYAYIVTRSENTQTAEDGTETTDVTVTVNGEIADAAAVEALWEQFGALAATERLTTAESGEKLLEIRVKAVSGVEETYAFTTYDVDSYQVQTADGASLLFSAEAVDKIIRTIRQL